MGQIDSKKPLNTPNDTNKHFLKSQRDLISEMDIPEHNGLVLNDILIPEEILTLILSFVDLKCVPKCLFVCKKWKEVVESQHLWRMKCERIGKSSKKKLKWYVYYALCSGDFFDVNLLKNNCGQDKFRHWKIKSNGGDKFIVESPPHGAKEVPEVPEIVRNSCFATSYQTCSKYQVVSFRNNSLHRKILDELKPAIHISEWYAARFDCGSVYILSIWLMDRSNKLMLEKVTEKRTEAWGESEWNKVEFLINCYSDGLSSVNFYHKGVDTQFWAGHYGSKMTGGVVMIPWDSVAK